MTLPQPPLGVPEEQPPNFVSLSHTDGSVDAKKIPETPLPPSLPAPEDDGFQQAPYALARDDPAFQPFYKKYEKMLYAFLLQILADKQDAEDVRQNTFKAAARSWSKIRTLEEKAQQQWLYTTGRRKAYDHFRWIRRRFQHWTAYLPGRSQERPLPEGDQEYTLPQGEVDYPQFSQLPDMTKEFHQSVQDRVNQLSRRERECLLLHSQGFSTAEIANICKLGESSVRGNISRAKARYKKIDSAWNASSPPKERNT